MDALPISSVLETIGVAPFAGAWIETEKQTQPLSLITSLPSRERGLKPCPVRKKDGQNGALPIWEQRPEQNRKCESWNS